MSLAQAMQIFSRPLPLVVTQCNNVGAQWFGKYTFNTDTATIKRLGGPWDTEAEACGVIESLGNYRRRADFPRQAGPHYDKIT